MAFEEYFMKQSFPFIWESQSLKLLREFISSNDNLMVTWTESVCVELPPVRVSMTVELVSLFRSVNWVKFTDEFKTVSLNSSVNVPLFKSITKSVNTG